MIKIDSKKISIFSKSKLGSNLFFTVYKNRKMEQALALRFSRINDGTLDIHRLIMEVMSYLRLIPLVIYDFDYDGALGGITDWSRRITAFTEKHYRGDYTKRQKEFEEDFWNHMDELDKRHPIAEKKVACGSARQDYATDIRNRTNAEKPYQHKDYRHILNDHTKGEGLVTRELEWLVESEYGRSHNWELYPLLWIDGDEATGTSWRNKTKNIDMDGPLGYIWRDNKVPLLKYQIGRLVRDFGSERPITVYFFDDRQDILDALNKSVVKSGLPANVNLILIRLDWNRKVLDSGRSVNFYGQ